MILVVFGAGASYDSNPDLPAAGNPHDFRMPLAAELFSNRELFAGVMDRFPKCRPILSYLRPRKDLSVEQELQKLSDEAPRDPKRLEQLAGIRYYLSLLISDCEEKWLSHSRNITNHETLLDQLRQGDDAGICLVTFNYDTLIERALPSVGVRIQTIPDYIGDPKYKLIKLHGSVNWGHRVYLEDFQAEFEQYPDSTANFIIDHIGRLQVQPEILHVSEGGLLNFYREEYKRLIQKGAMYEVAHHIVGHLPAIAIPVQAKSDFECPAKHVDALRAILPQVDKILIIGWRATEKPFLDMLSEGLTRQRGIRGLVVAEDSKPANETVNRLAETNVLVAANFEIDVTGFSGFVRSRRLDHFLAS